MGSVRYIGALAVDGGACEEDAVARNRTTESQRLWSPLPPAAQSDCPGAHVANRPPGVDPRLGARREDVEADTSTVKICACCQGCATRCLGVGAMISGPS